MKKFLLLIIILVCTGEPAAQYPTNLEVMNEVLGGMLKSLGPVWQQKGVSSLRVNLEGDLKYFEGRILEEEKSLLREAGEEYILTIRELGVHYKNPERNGLLGEMMYEREVYIKMEWYAKSSGVKDFSAAVTDTIPEKFITEAEQQYLPFTVGKKDSPSFFSGYFEEITAAVVTGVAAYLFFTVRSK